MYVWVLEVGGGKCGHNSRQNTWMGLCAFFKCFKYNSDLLAPKNKPQVVPTAVSVLGLNTNKTWLPWSVRLKDKITL